MAKLRRPTPQQQQDHIGQLARCYLVRQTELIRSHRGEENVDQHRLVLGTLLHHLDAVRDAVVDRRQHLGQVIDPCSLEALVDQRENVPHSRADFLLVVGQRIGEL